MEYSKYSCTPPLYSLFVLSHENPVITPFFKVAPFIERCETALLEQTLHDVEFIFVDDTSPDESREILEKVIARHPERNARIITHPVNKGLPAARNTGLTEAMGDFIYHCDSDDWVETDMLEKMYKAAINNQADYVYCDFWMQFEKSARYMVNPSYTESEQMIKEWFPESNRYVMENRHLPFRTRLVQWFAAKGLFPMVSLYEFLINKVYYGLRYRS